MKRVLVTGGSGFIGQYCLPLLLYRGYEVHAFSRSASGEQEAIHWHAVNMLDFNAVEEKVAEIQPTHLLHLAWYVEHGKFWQANENLDWVQASLNLIKAFARVSGQRFLGVGSCAEYDWSQGVCDERDTPLKPKTFYGKCKNSFREVAAGYCDNNQISFSWGRLFHLYGPNEDSRRLIPYTMERLLRGESATIHSANKQRDFLHVEDVASALVSLLDSDLQGEMNIGSGEAYLIGDVVNMMAEMIGTGHVELHGSMHTDTDPEMLIPRVNRLMTELGWKPRYSLMHGMAHMVKLYQESMKNDRREST